MKKPPDPHPPPSQPPFQSTVQPFLPLSANQICIFIEELFGFRRRASRLLHISGLQPPATPALDRTLVLVMRWPMLRLDATVKGYAWPFPTRVTSKAVKWKRYSPAEVPAGVILPCYLFGITKVIRFSSSLCVFFVNLWVLIKNSPCLSKCLSCFNLEYIVAPFICWIVFSVGNCLVSWVFVDARFHGDPGFELVGFVGFYLMNFKLMHCSLSLLWVISMLGWQAVDFSIFWWVSSIGSCPQQNCGFAHFYFLSNWTVLSGSLLSDVETETTMAPLFQFCWQLFSYFDLVLWFLQWNAPLTTQIVLSLCKIRPCSSPEQMGFLSDPDCCQLFFGTFCCWNLFWTRPYRVLCATGCFQLWQPQYLAGLSTVYDAELFALSLSETNLKPLVHSRAQNPASFAPLACLFSFPPGSDHFINCCSYLAKFNHVLISILGRPAEYPNSRMVIHVAHFDFFKHISYVGFHCQYLLFVVNWPCAILLVKKMILLFSSVCYVSVVSFLRTLIIRTPCASGVALPFMVLDEPNEFCVLYKWFLSRLVSCLFCLSTVQAILKLFTWNSRCDQLVSRCWVGPNGTRQSQVCSSSHSMASWISPLFSREYSCGLHGNMLRMHGHVLDHCGYSLDFFWIQILMDYGRKRLKRNYLWRSLSSCLCGSLVMVCSYSFGFVRCFHAMACMIILVHSIGCILVILNCRFVNRPLSLKWCALCLQLIRVCKPLTMELSRFGSAPLLYYDLNSCGLLCVTCGLLHL